MTIRQLALTSLSDGGGGGSGMCRMDFWRAAGCTAGPHAARCRTGYPPPVPPLPPYGLAENTVAICSTVLSFNTTVLSPKKRGRNIHGGVWCRCTCPPRIRQAASPSSPAAHAFSECRRPSPRVLARPAALVPAHALPALGGASPGPRGICGGRPGAGVRSVCFRSVQLRLQLNRAWNASRDQRANVPVFPGFVAVNAVPLACFRVSAVTAWLRLGSEE